MPHYSSSSWEARWKALRKYCRWHWQALVCSRAGFCFQICIFTTSFFITEVCDSLHPSSCIVWVRVYHQEELEEIWKEKVKKPLFSGDIDCYISRLCRPFYQLTLWGCAASCSGSWAWPGVLLSPPTLVPQAEVYSGCFSKYLLAVTFGSLLFQLLPLSCKPWFLYHTFCYHNITVALFCWSSSEWYCLLLIYCPPGRCLVI